MSSIRDALKRAERERLSRVTTPRPGDQVEQETSGSAGSTDSNLHVVNPPLIPAPRLPIDFTQELAHFRQGVETALPQPHRSIVLTSANSSEGVTTLANYLAASLAIRDNKKTCLIDVNFESPKTTRLLGLLGQPGFSDYCSGNASLTDVLLRTESPNLYVMGLGTENYNPSLTVGSDRARSLPAELTQRFEYVLFDAGSVLNHAETSMLAGYADGVVLIVRANRTKREVLLKADKLMRFSGGRLIGTVLNRRTFPIPDSIYRRL